LIEFGAAEIGAASPELFAPTPRAEAAAEPDAATLAIVPSDAVGPVTPGVASASDGDSEASDADTFIASDEDAAAGPEEDAAAAPPPPPPDMLAELKNEAIFALSYPHLSCRDENCRDFACLQNVQHAREFPTGAAAKLPGSGINMYAVFMYRHALGVRLR
jgi:hypothetical protein